MARMVVALIRDPMLPLRCGSRRGPNFDRQIKRWNRGDDSFKTKWDDRDCDSAPKTWSDEDDDRFLLRLVLFKTAGIATDRL